MNMLSLLSPPAPPLASVIPLPGVAGTGAFDALIGLQTAASAVPAAAPQSPAVETLAVVLRDDARLLPPVQAPAEVAVAMVATLDRSATLLPQPQERVAQIVPVPVATPAEAEVAVGPQTPAAVVAMPVMPQVRLPAMLVRDFRGSKVADKAPPDPSPDTGPDTKTKTTDGDGDSAADATLPTDVEPVPVSIFAVPVTTSPVADVVSAPAAPVGAAAPAAALMVDTRTVPAAIALQVAPAVALQTQLPGDRDEAVHPLTDEPNDAAAVLAPIPLAVRETTLVSTSLAVPPAPPGVVVVERHLDLARSDAWLDDLARDIAATASTGGRLKFALAPETLGRLDVEVRQGSAGVSIHMTTRNDTARDLLTNAQPRIVDEIRMQGVRVAGAEVATDTSGFSGDRAGGASRQHSGQQAGQQPMFPINAALSAPPLSSPRTLKSAVDGRYA